MSGHELSRVALIGDSISIHYAPYLVRFLEGVFDFPQAKAPSPWEVNWGDSARILKYLREDRPPLPAADFLLFNCGLHDIKTDPATGSKQVPLEQYRENLREVIGILASRFPYPVWVRTTPCDENVHNTRVSEFHRFAADCLAYNAAADDCMAAAGIPGIDLHAFTAALGPDVFCDHVHFHERVRDKQASFIAGWLSSRLAPSAPRRRGKD